MQATWTVSGTRLGYSAEAEDYLTYTEVVVVKSKLAADKAREQLERHGYTVKVTRA